MARSLTDILEHPTVYNLLQWSTGASKVRNMCMESLALSPESRVLDIGCGPAYYVGGLPPCEYHGFDTDARYIAHARKRFGHRAQFYAEPYTEERRRTLPPFDRVILMGLLHHLDDADCDSLLSLVARSLAPGGYALSLDTVLFEGQSRFSRFLAVHDRGLFSRSPEGFLALGHKHFESVEPDILGDTLRLPAAHYLMKLSGPRG